MSEKNINKCSDNANNKTELKDSELNKVSGGSGPSIDLDTTKYLNRYVYVPSIKQSGKITNIRKKYVSYGQAVEFTVSLNKGGEIVLRSEGEFEFLPDGMIDKQESEDGQAVSLTF